VGAVEPKTNKQTNTITFDSITHEFPSLQITDANINAICCSPLSFIISVMYKDVILMTTRQEMDVNVTLRRFRATIVAVEN
jgi:hypothetical protein